MKNRYLSILFVLITGGIFAQSAERISEVYTSEQIQELQSEKPDKYRILELYAEQGFAVREGQFKNEKFVEISGVPTLVKGRLLSYDQFKEAIASESFNPLTILYRPKVQAQIYRLKDTNLYIVVPSIDQLKHSQK